MVLLYMVHLYGLLYTTVSILVFTRSFAACRERAAARRWSAPAQAVGPRRSAAGALVRVRVRVSVRVRVRVSPKP